MTKSGIRVVGEVNRIRGPGEKKNWVGVVDVEKWLCTVLSGEATSLTRWRRLTPEGEARGGRGVWGRGGGQRGGGGGLGWGVVDVRRVVVGSSLEECRRSILYGSLSVRSS